MAESRGAYEARRYWAYRLDLWLHDHVEWLWWRLPARWTRWWA